MREYCFDVIVHYRTAAIYAENEEEAKEIAYKELDFYGEEYDMTMELLYEEEVEQ